MPSNDQTLANHDLLKLRLMEVGIAIPGTIHALYSRCGSPTCPCAKDDSKRHGPYYRWHYRTKGRLIAKGLQSQDLLLFKQWIENREMINRIVDEMLENGARHAASRTPARPTAGNPRKTGKPMRGK